MCLNPKGPACAGFAPNCSGEPTTDMVQKGASVPTVDRAVGVGQTPGRGWRALQAWSPGRWRVWGGDGEATGTPWTVVLPGCPVVCLETQTGALEPTGGSETSTVTFPSAAPWPHSLRAGAHSASLGYCHPALTERPRECSHRKPSVSLAVMSRDGSRGRPSGLRRRPGSRTHDGWGAPPGPGSCLLSEDSASCHLQPRKTV